MTEPASSTSNTTLTLCAELERVGMERVKELRTAAATGSANDTNDTNDTMIHDLSAIINDGNAAFHAVHGRNMTYSEMRSIYG
jgi:hypothetical protein